MPLFTYSSATASIIPPPTLNLAVESTTPPRLFLGLILPCDDPTVFVHVRTSLVEFEGQARFRGSEGTPAAVAVDTHYVATPGENCLNRVPSNYDGEVLDVITISEDRYYVFAGQERREFAGYVVAASGSRWLSVASASCCGVQYLGRIVPRSGAVFLSAPPWPRIEYAVKAAVGSTIIVYGLRPNAYGLMRISVDCAEPEEVDVPVRAAVALYEGVGSRLEEAMAAVVV